MCKCSIHIPTIKYLHQMGHGPLRHLNLMNNRWKILGIGMTVLAVLPVTWNPNRLHIWLITWTTTPHPCTVHRTSCKGILCPIFHWNTNPNIKPTTTSMIILVANKTGDGMKTIISSQTKMGLLFSPCQLITQMTTNLVSIYHLPLGTGFQPTWNTKWTTCPFQTGKSPNPGRRSRTLRPTSTHREMKSLLGLVLHHGGLWMHHHQ